MAWHKIANIKFIYQKKKKATLGSADWVSYVRNVSTSLQKMHTMEKKTVHGFQNSHTFNFFFHDLCEVTLVFRTL